MEDGRLEMSFGGKAIVRPRNVESPQAVEQNHNEMEANFQG